MYMVVENNALELPIAVYDTCKECAESLDLTESGVWSRIHSGTKRKEKIIYVDEREKMNRKEYQAQYRKKHDRREYFRERYLRRKENEQ